MENLSSKVRLTGHRPAEGDSAVNRGPLEIKSGTSAANGITLCHHLLGVFIPREISVSAAAKGRRKAELAPFKES